MEYSTEDLERGAIPLKDFTSEFLHVGDLVIDREIQREKLNRAKVQEIVASYNKKALGVIHVSRRKNGTQAIIDGQHRFEATRIKFDNDAVMLCHVYLGLSKAEEAQMFLDLNYTTQPPQMDKFKVRQLADGTAGMAARDIADILSQQGWTMSNVPGNGHVNAVRVVERLYALSEKLGSEPNLVKFAMLVVTKAWLTDRYGAQGPILEALGRMYAEYGSTIDLTRLINVLREYPGGPRNLLGESRQLATVNKIRHSAAVAHLIIGLYNKGLKNKSLHPWRQK